MASATPVDPAPPAPPKMPLGHRKNVKDNFEKRLPEFQERVSKAIGVRFEIDVDIQGLYFSVISEDWQRQSFGSLLAAYFEALCSGMESFVENGEDKEAQEAITAVTPKRRVSLIPDSSGKVSYCALSIMDGVICILFKPIQFGVNIGELSSFYIASATDKALTAINPLALPIATRRAIKADLDPKLPRMKEQLSQLFGREVNIAYNFQDMLAVFGTREFGDMEYRYYSQEGVLPGVLPSNVAKYLQSAVDSLVKHNFGKDNLLNESWVVAAPRGVLFEVVENLRTQSPYNECLFDEGYFKLRTIPKYFGLHCDQIADSVVDRL